MTVRERVLALDARLASLAQASAPRPAVFGPTIELAEICGSMRFAGFDLRPREVAELVTLGRTPAGASLEACNAIADYAAAARYVSVEGKQRPRQPFLRIEEIVTAHALATRRSSVERPGKWRAATAAAQRSGAVPPPAWFVPRDMTALVERFASGPGNGHPILPWLADFHARLRRIAPFSTANGRVARLCLNLLLARLRYPPLIVAPNGGPRFAAALDRAVAGDLWPSALFLGRSMEKTFRDFGHSPHDELLLTLPQIAGKTERAALYKAAQRGRLRTVREGTSVFTSKLWVQDYRSSRAAAGRPPAVRPLV